MSLRFVLITAVLLALAGCGSTSTVRQAYTPAQGAKYQIGNITTSAVAKDEQPPEHFLAAVKGHLKSQLSKQGLTAADETSGHKIAIDVTGYRMRSGFTRAFFGVFAGKDGITSNVTVSDASGRVLGQSGVSTSNVLAIGSEDDIARMHAEEIAKFVSGATK